MANNHFKNLLCQILGCSKPDKKNRVAFGWSVGQPKLKKKGNRVLELTISNEQKVKVHVNPVTDAGKPAKLDGVPKWSVVSGPGTVVPADDGLSADLVSADDDLSDTTFLVDADANLGTEVEDVQDTILLHVTHANAKNLGLTADAPVLK